MNSIKQIKIKKPNKLSAFFICLIIATVLWVLHALNTVYTKQFSIPVNFTNQPQNKISANDFPKELKISVKASGLKLVLIGLKEPFNETTIDFSELKSDRNNNHYFISSNLKRFYSLFKFKAEIKSIYPDTIAFVYKEGTQKVVPVKVPSYLSFKPGYTGSELEVTPKTIVINGDINELLAIDTLYTEPLYLNDIDSDVRQKIRLNLAGRVVVLSQRSVEVSLRVDKLIEKELEIPIIIKTPLANYKHLFFPSRVKLKVSLPQNNFKILDTLSIIAAADVIANSKNKMTIKLNNVPKYVNVLSFEPKEVEFLIIRK